MSPAPRRAATRSARRESLGLGWRLGSALGLVVVAGAVTLLLVALLVAPSVFHTHLEAALPGGIAPSVQVHVDEAFASAVLVSLGVAVPVALLTAAAVTWVVIRRLTRSISALATAAERVASGDLGARVAAPTIGPELAQLAGSFNAMADRLADTELTRRRLVGDLAHELRTPLASLEATVAAVADGVLPPDATTMATLQEQTDRLSHLVADMAAVSRAEERQLALDLQRLDVAEAARRAVTAHQARFTAAGRRLDLDVRSGLPPVRADARRLGEALGNLLDNAAEHSPRGGTVRVVVRTAPTGAAIEVRDTGSGFLPDEAERLFERFYRGDASRTGAGAHSGVGLTIARAIAEAQGGTLLATSAGPGTGATFTLTLQRDPDHG